MFGIMMSSLTSGTKLVLQEVEELDLWHGTSWVAWFLPAAVVNNDRSAGDC